MKKFIKETGVVTPLDRSNVDTDAIIPKQFLKSIKKSGFGVNLFDEWRYLDEGQPDVDTSKRPINKDFVLNNPIYKDSTILLARENFGCGSSREHAVWALSDYGFRAVIAPSLADIFYNNCFKNGVLPIKLANSEINEIFKLVTDKSVNITIDLELQKVITEQAEYSFSIDEFRKDSMLKGLDAIGLTLQKSDKIKEFEEKYKQANPWAFESVGI